jgi:hypothetical protein
MYENLITLAAIACLTRRYSIALFFFFKTLEGTVAHLFPNYINGLYS